MPPESPSAAPLAKMTRAQLIKAVKFHQSMAYHGWKNYEVEHKWSTQLRRERDAALERLAKYEWSMEYQS